MDIELDQQTSPAGQLLRDGLTETKKLTNIYNMCLRDIMVPKVYLTLSHILQVQICREYLDLVQALSEFG